MLLLGVNSLQISIFFSLPTFELDLGNGGDDSILEERTGILGV